MKLIVLENRCPILFLSVSTRSWLDRSSWSPVIIFLIPTTKGWNSGLKYKGRVWLPVLYSYYMTSLNTKSKSVCLKPYKWDDRQTGFRSWQMSHKVGYNVYTMLIVKDSFLIHGRWHEWRNVRNRNLGVTTLVLW